MIVKTVIYAKDPQKIEHPAQKEPETTLVEQLLALGVPPEKLATDKIKVEVESRSWATALTLVGYILPFILFGTQGGRIAQRYGPFRVSALGLVLGAGYMTMYGFLGSPYLMLGFGVTQSIVDSLTVTGTGIAVAQVAPVERQAGASGLLGGMQTLTGGIAATLAGVTYEHFGRAAAFSATAVVMVVMVVTGCFLAGPKWMGKPTDSAVVLTHQ